MLRHDNVNGLCSGACDKWEKRKSKNKKSKDRPELVAGADWTWKGQVDQVNFPKSPIGFSVASRFKRTQQAGLGRFPLHHEVYGWGLPNGQGQSEIDNVYTILMVLKY